ncbi:MAG: MFS transporter [Phototrophicaceae bacterium]
MGFQLSDSLSVDQRERIYRRNFIYFLLDNALFNIGYNLAGTTTVIPDFLGHLTNSQVLIGLLSNFFSIGNTLPQLFVARLIVRHTHKKSWFIFPNLFVRWVIILFALITVMVGKDQPNLILLAFALCYGIASIGDGLVVVPYVEMIGSSLDNRWRARMFGLTTTITSISMLLVAPLVGYILSNFAFPNNYAIIFGIAGIFYTLSILPGLFMTELVGSGQTGSVQPFHDFLPHLADILRVDRSYRAYIIARFFSALFMMTAPYYIGFATVDLGLSSAVAIPTLLAIQTIGGLCGSIVFAWLGARNNRHAMILALACSVLSPILALSAGEMRVYPLYLSFWLAGFSSGSLIYAYINWLVGYTTAEQRPIYTGLSSTIIAITALVAPFMGGTIVEQLGYPSLFIFALITASCALLTVVFYLPERSNPH